MRGTNHTHSSSAGLIALVIVASPLSFSERTFAESLLTEQLVVQDKKQECPDWLHSRLGKLHSKDTISLCEVMFQKPALIVNTASHRGFTKQFGGLEKLYQDYKDKGLFEIHGSVSSRHFIYGMTEC